MTREIHRNGMDLEENKELKAKPAQRPLFAADSVRGSYNTNKGTK